MEKSRSLWTLRSSNLEVLTLCKNTVNDRLELQSQFQSFWVQVARLLVLKSATKVAPSKQLHEGPVLPKNCWTPQPLRRDVLLEKFFSSSLRKRQILHCEHHRALSAIWLNNIMTPVITGLLVFLKNGAYQKIRFRKFDSSIIELVCPDFRAWEAGPCCRVLVHGQTKVHAIVPYTENCSLS